MKSEKYPVIGLGCIDTVLQSLEGLIRDQVQFAVSFDDSETVTISYPIKPLTVPSPPEVA